MRTKVGYGIRCVTAGAAVMGDDEAAGDWLAGFDPDFAGGLGAAWWTPESEEAMVFGSIAEAIHFYRTQSQTRPQRADGLPNRPLTAYTIEVTKLP